MKRWQKTALFGTLAGGAAYGADALLSRNPDPAQRYGWAAVPAAVAGLTVAAATWLLSRPDPGEGYPDNLPAAEGVAGLHGFGYYTWPPSCLPQWPYVQGWNAYTTQLPPGTAGRTASR